MNFPTSAFQTSYAGAGGHGQPSHGLAGDPSDEAPGDLRSAFEALWRRKWLFLLIVCLAGAAAAWQAAQIDERYRATTKVLFEPRPITVIGSSDLLADRDVTATVLQNQIEILRSAELIQKVAEALELETLSELYPFADRGTPSLVERLFSPIAALPDLRSGLQRLGMAAPPAADGPAAEGQAAEAQAHVVNALIGEVELRLVPDSQVIAVSFTSTDPTLAASVVNTIADQYIEMQIEAKRSQVSAANELLRIRVQDLEQRLVASEEAVDRARLEMSAETGYGADMATEELQTVAASLASARQARIESEARHQRAFEALNTKADLQALTAFRESPLIQNYRLQESDLLSQLAGYRAIGGLSVDNPTVARLEAQLAEVRRNIRSEAGSIVASLQAELDAASERESALAAQLAELEARAADRSRAELRVQRLEREAAASREIHESLLARMIEASEQVNLQSPDARVLTRATTVQPAGVSDRQVIAMGTMAGIVFAVGVIFLLERLNGTFRSSRQLEARTGLPVLAEIPRVRRRVLEPLVEIRAGGRGGPLAEAIRSLQTTILFSDTEQRAPQSVMLTSSVAAEGKTTLAMLLAITSARIGRSAILVDCDLRQAAAPRRCPTDESRPGLVAVLEGRADLDEAICVDPASDLHILGAERLSEAHGDCADLLASPRLRTIIEGLKTKYDQVIIDTPPVLPVADACIVAQVADCVIYVVRAERVERTAVIDGLRELRMVRATIGGLALNMSKTARVERYGYGPQETASRSRKSPA